MDSILKTVRKFIGPSESYEYFDDSLLMCINTAINVLYQAGVGPKGFVVEDENTTWSDYLGDDLTNLQAVKTYICQSTRLDFDPPANSFLVERIKKTMDEIYWRLNVMVDPERIDE